MDFLNKFIEMTRKNRFLEMNIAFYHYDVV